MAIGGPMWQNGNVNTFATVTRTTITLGHDEGGGNVEWIAFGD